MSVRVVVSGQNATGKSVIVSDEVIEPINMVVDIHPLWSSSHVPRFPIDGKRAQFPAGFPPAGGYQFLVMTLPPSDGTRNAVVAPSQEDLKGAAAGMAHVMEKDNPGMHTTDTVDFEVVLSGEASMELDDGVTVHLKAGDCFVQNGTRHRWFNRSKVPAVVAVVVIGGEPRR